MRKPRKPSKVTSKAEAQLAVAREVAERRRDALADLAVAEQIMEEDWEILRALAKK